MHTQACQTQCMGRYNSKEHFNLSHPLFASWEILRVPFRFGNLRATWKRSNSATSRFLAHLRGWNRPPWHCTSISRSTPETEVVLDTFMSLKGTKIWTQDMTIKHISSSSQPSVCSKRRKTWYIGKHSKSQEMRKRCDSNKSGCPLVN